MEIVNESESDSSSEDEVQYRDYSFKQYEVVDSRLGIVRGRYLIENKNHRCSLYKEVVTTRDNRKNSICFDLVKSLPYIDTVGCHIRQIHMERLMLKDKNQKLQLREGWN